MIGLGRLLGSNKFLSAKRDEIRPFLRIGCLKVDQSLAK